MPGAQILRSEAYLRVRRNAEGCSATPQMDLLRSHQSLELTNLNDGEVYTFLLKSCQVFFEASHDGYWGQVFTLAIFQERG